MADTSLVESKIGLLIWKTSNFWQANLRKSLNIYNISLNEFFILGAIKSLSKKRVNINQKEISEFIGIDISVTSVTLKLLENKKYISRTVKDDNRKKVITILKDGSNLFEIIDPIIQKTEDQIFNKLNNETFNFTNSLKLILGKKIRIKANREK